MAAAVEARPARRQVVITVRGKLLAVRLLGAARVETAEIQQRPGKTRARPAAVVAAADKWALAVQARTAKSLSQSSKKP